MKIVFVSYHYWPPYFGGELRISIERFESLVKRGHQVVVLTSGSPGYRAHEFINGIEIFRSPEVHPSKTGRGMRRLLFPHWVVRTMKNIDFDIMHFAGTGGVDPITSNFGNWLTCKTAKRKGAKLVCVHSLADTEEEMYTERGFNRRLRKFTLDQMDAIVSVSPALHEGVKKYYPASAHLLPYGIRDDIFSRLPAGERSRLRSEYAIPENQVLISFLGSVSLRKGFDLLANVFFKVHEQYPDWCLWIIGPYTKTDNQNIDNGEMQALVDELKQFPNVRFWGRIDDRKHLATLLALSDLFVFPSRKEGMGIAPLEAMAAGVPVIISRIPGVTDLANVEGETGLYIEVDNCESLQSAMIKLGTNMQLRQKMGSAAHQRIVNDFSWEKYIDDLEVLYTSLLAA